MNISLDYGLRNINGPSLIKAPSWFRQPLGKYYLYFAHHRGTFIRLMYSDNLDGPWSIYGPGVLHLNETPARWHYFYQSFPKHIASPDVHIDSANKRLLMYFHGFNPHSFRQVTWLAESNNGVQFRVISDILAPWYLRSWESFGNLYGLARGATQAEGTLVLKSHGHGEQFKVIGSILPFSRHTAIEVTIPNKTALVIYSLYSDTPEYLRGAFLDLPSLLIGEFHMHDHFDVLRPEYSWEGADRPASRSCIGDCYTHVRQLRDPGLMNDDGRMILVYTVAGEEGLALARLLRGSQYDRVQVASQSCFLFGETVFALLALFLRSVPHMHLF